MQQSKVLYCKIRINEHIHPDLCTLFVLRKFHRRGNQIMTEADLNVWRKRNEKKCFPSVIDIFLYLNILIFLQICECSITILPRETVLIATNSFKFTCTGDFYDRIDWFKTGSNGNENVTGYTNRYYITNKFHESTLQIKSSTLEDSGEFFCKTVSGELSDNAKLEVIAPPQEWFPRCSQHPEKIKSGENVDITCVSSNPLTSRPTVSLPDLAWTQNGEIISNIPFQNNSTHKSLKYTWTVNRDDNGKQFICQASMRNLQNQPSCSVTLFVEWSNRDIVPYIIVAVLSIIALVLFGVVIIFVFRFRECKYCKETIPQPQQVLDMSALQGGGGVPMTVTSDQSSDDDVVGLPNLNRKTRSKKQTKTKSSVKSCTHNITKQSPQERKNLEVKGFYFDDNFQKQEESKEYETKTKDIDLSIKQSKEKLRPKSIKDQTSNIPGRSVGNHPRKALQITPNELPNKRPKEPIGNINNLGSSVSSATKRASSKSDSRLKADDRVVYADLDFARNPGLNITKDEYS